MRALVIALGLAGLVLVPGHGTAQGLQKHSIVAEETTESHRKLAVRLERRIAQSDLAQLAEAIRQRGARAAPRTFVDFYLPGMKVGEGAWATATFSPDLRIVIHGLRLEEEQYLVDELRADKRDIVGAWLTAAPAPAGRLLIFREGRRVMAEWRLRNGEKTVEEVIEQRSQRGRRFDVSSGERQHYVITPTGDLELRDDRAVVALAERMVIERPAAATPGTQDKAKPAAEQPTAATLPVSPNAVSAQKEEALPPPSTAVTTAVGGEARPAAREEAPKARRATRAVPQRASGAQTSGGLTRQQFMR